MIRLPFSSRSFPCLLALSLLTCSIALVGCGTTANSALPVTAPSSHLVASGSVHGGQQVIAGARIYLYAVATTQGGASVSLLNTPGFVLTDANGNFSITGDYTCPANSYVYLLALGGNPGLVNAVNPAIGLGAGLGLCSSLTASTFITINEVTTVAMTSALASSATSETQIGSPFNLAIPFQNIALLANQASGFASNSSNSAIVPTAALNSLANSIAACVNSTGIGGTCASLFADANVVVGGATPADTFQAALNIAQNPTRNVSAIYSLGAASGVFAPTLPVAPSTWNVAATDFTGNGCIPPDANTYVLNTTRGDIIVELRPDIAPKNVANFLAYVNNGAYDNSIIHRLVPNFAVQGGGYKYNGSGQVIAIPTLGTVPGEPGLSNRRGTLAMANTPNSAGSQFFFNLEDNPALDTQNGGYTVIGNLINAEGSLQKVNTIYTTIGCNSLTGSLAVIDAFQNFDTVVNAGTPFDSLPVVNYTSGTTLQPSNLEYVNSIVALFNPSTTATTPIVQFGPPDPSTGNSVVGYTDSQPGATIYYAYFTDGGPDPTNTVEEFYQQGNFVPYTAPVTVGPQVIIVAYATAPGLPNPSDFYGFFPYPLRGQVPVLNFK